MSCRRQIALPLVEAEVKAKDGQPQLVRETSKASQTTTEGSDTWSSEDETPERDDRHECRTEGREALKLIPRVCCLVARRTSEVAQELQLPKDNRTRRRRIRRSKHQALIPSPVPSSPAASCAAHDRRRGRGQSAEASTASRSRSRS